MRNQRRHVPLARETRLPKDETKPTPFESAKSTVCAWLDGPGSNFAKRISQHSASKKHTWELELNHPLIGIQRVRLSLPINFPSAVPEIHIDKNVCLILPHIEESGRFCHGVEPAPEDYENPNRVVQEVLQRLEDFWERSTSDEWIQNEFQNERLSYWIRFCERYSISHGPRVPDELRVSLSGVIDGEMGKVAAYFSNGLSKRSSVMVVSGGSTDPNSLAKRHGWAKGTLVRGDSLFISMPVETAWQPNNWPTTFDELESLVHTVSGFRLSVREWLLGRAKDEAGPLVVILMQGSHCFAYKILSAPVPLLTQPNIIPLSVNRIDSGWALARDHQVEVLNSRAKKTVLVLGCGSLGAPIAELLARAGIGTLHLLDKEVFAAENCVRHILGAPNIGVAKADALAVRLRQLVPEIEVKEIRAFAADWISNVCKPDTYDLILDCTGESSVRIVLSKYKKLTLGNSYIAHAWMEPHCAAAHVVFLRDCDSWPLSDPTHKVHVAEWKEDGKVQLPACGAGFHPYGASDAWQAAAFATERVLSCIDNKIRESTVWSWIRSTSFFKNLGLNVEIGPLVPRDGAEHDSIQITRSFTSLVK